MKATDLMIGDWIEFNNQPSKIECIYTEFGFRVEGNDNPIMEYELSPIPLTDEMLELNGFIDNRKTLVLDLGFTYWDNGDLCIEMHNELNYLEIVVKYVHELQHALRLCGLNDMANNFKLKE